MNKCTGYNNDDGSPCKNMNTEKQRQNTRYVDDERNWVTLCPKCMKDNEEYWQDMWDDYYSDCL